MNATLWGDAGRRRWEQLEGSTDPLAVELRAVLAEGLRLADRFDKVVAISDKFQRLLESGPPPQPIAVEAPRAEDPTWLALASQIPDPSVQTLVRQYRKVQSQLNKIVSISDRFQAELREATWKLEMLARLDYLTNVSNRRDMVDRLEVELARAIRKGTPLSVILLDVDRFKSVNDERGHEMGDVALAAVAATLKSKVRRSDSCGRWGGEEFLILCPETSREEAFVVAEKCRAGVEALAIGPDEEPVRLTVSGGVGFLDPLPDHWSTLVAQADVALYRAKEAGRNRVL